MPESPPSWLDVLDRLFMQMIEQQERKVMGMARAVVPNLTSEDLRNPQDFPALTRDPIFNFEDGQLAGLRSAHIAVRAELLQRGGPS